MGAYLTAFLYGYYLKVTIYTRYQGAENGGPWFNFEFNDWMESMIQSYFNGALFEL